MITGIKHIIFDLGGVILDIDYNATEKAFIDLGIKDFPALYSQLHQTDLFNRWEMGMLSRDEFITTLQNISSVPITGAQIIKAWDAMLITFPLRRLQILQQLRLHHDLFLLSNTNEVHEEGFNRILMQEHGIPNIGVFFDKVYLSHRIGMRKPGKEIYLRVLEESGLKPEHTLFIDDSEQNIAPAKEAGIQTIFLKKGMSIEEDVFKAK